VEDVYPERGGVVLDLDRLADKLESVGELEKELRGFQEVFHAGGHGRGVVVHVGSEFRRQSIGEEGM
jgi:hypothetical protein